MATLATYFRKDDAVIYYEEALTPPRPRRTAQPGTLAGCAHYQMKMSISSANG